MKRIPLIIILICSLAILGPQVAAQPAPAPQDRPPAGMPDWQRHPGPVNRMEMLRIWKLSEFLELDQDQATQFFPALQAHRDAMHEIDSTIVDLHRAIFNRVNQQDVSQRQVNEWQKQLMDLQQQKTAREQAFLKSLPQYLSPEQQAKYLVFEWRFQQMLRNAIRARGHWPGPQDSLQQQQDRSRP